MVAAPGAGGIGAAAAVPGAKAALHPAAAEQAGAALSAIAHGGRQQELAMGPPADPPGGAAAEEDAQPSTSYTAYDGMTFASVSGGDAPPSPGGGLPAGGCPLGAVSGTRMVRDAERDAPGMRAAPISSPECTQHALAGAMAGSIEHTAMFP